MAKKDDKIAPSLTLDDLTITAKGEVRTRKGGFVKGVSGNPAGRPRKVDITKAVAENEVLSDALITAAQSGEAKRAMEELLKTAKNRTEMKQIAKELLPYQTPKKASIETKITDFRKIEFHMVMPEAMSQLESIYKQDPKLVEQLSDDDIKSITDNTFTIDNLTAVNEQGSDKTTTDLEQ